MLDRTLAPHYRAIDHIELIKPEYLKFDNGCSLYWFDGGEQELVRIEWVFKNLEFNAAKPLLNVAVNSMLTDGTESMSSAQIADAVDYYGAFLQVEYGFDHSQLTLYTLNKHIAHVLPVVKHILTKSVFPANELDTFIRNQQQKLQVNMEKNDFVARRAFNRAIYGDNIYGLCPSVDDYQALQQADLLAHYKQMYQPGNCTIIVAGRVDKETLTAITSAFGQGWQSNAVYSADEPSLVSSDELLTYIEKPEALQSAIRMGMVTINRHHPDFPALQVVSTILGGYFGSRLMSNIREDKGYTYGIGSALTSLKHSGTFFISTEVGTEVTQATLTEIEKEINILKTEPISDDELALVRNYILGSLLGSLENVFSHADKFKFVYPLGLDFEYYDRYTQVVRTIDANTILAIANKYLDYQKLHKVVVGKY